MSDDRRHLTVAAIAARTRAYQITEPNLGALGAIRRFVHTERSGNCSGGGRPPAA